jgi:hypothetical protein
MIYTPDKLAESDFICLKCFPSSLYGLDFCVPSDRLKIAQYFLGVLSYLASGTAKIGDY